MVKVGGVDCVVYVVIKYVVEGFIKLMVIEWGFFGICVNMICFIFVVMLLIK